MAYYNHYLDQQVHQYKFESSLLEYLNHGFQVKISEIIFQYVTGRKNLDEDNPGVINKPMLQRIVDAQKSNNYKVLDHYRFRANDVLYGVVDVASFKNFQVYKKWLNDLNVELTCQEAACRFLNGRAHHQCQEFETCEFLNQCSNCHFSFGFASIKAARKINPDFEQAYNLNNDLCPECFIDANYHRCIYCRQAMFKSQVSNHQLNCKLNKSSGKVNPLAFKVDNNNDYLFDHMLLCVEESRKSLKVPLKQKTESYNYGIFA